MPLAHPLTCEPGNNSGAAGYIENVLSGTGLRSTYEVVCPFRCNRWHQVSFVKLRRTSVELPMVEINHCGTLPALEEPVLAF